MSFSTELFLEYKKRPGKATLARLLEHHQDAVYSVCLQVLRHPQDAEDACQEVLLEVTRQVDAVDEPASFGGWLYRTALHTALDVKRRRGRQRIRESGASRPAESPTATDSADALHQGLAGLDDTSRSLVVEHYFARRTLRELAAERGCSEVAVWKRIQSARERLRKVIGSAAMAALDGIGKVQAPGGLLTKALLRGGLTMAASGGIKLAILAPLVLLAGAGVAMVARRSEPAPQVAPAKTAAVRQSPNAMGTAGAATATNKRTANTLPAPVPAKASVPRRPYPLNIPAAPARSQSAEHTWSILQTKRVTIDEQYVPLPKILQRLAEETGIAIVADPQLVEGETISFKVQDIVVDGCLRLMLQPRDKSYEIRSDGTVAVVLSKNTVEDSPEARKVNEALQELSSARVMLDAGWDGLRDPDELSRKGDNVQAKKITLPQGESSVREELLRLRQEYQVYVDEQFSPDAAGAAGGEPSPMDERFLQVVGETTIGDHLEQLARRCGLTALNVGRDVFWMTTAEAARNYLAGEEERRRQYRESLEVLGKPLPEAGTLFVQDLLDSIPRSLGVELLSDKAAWESAASVTLPAGATLRDALDAIKTQGYRWALLRGKILVLK